MRLIFMGKILKDEKSIQEYKIVDGSKMALIVRKVSRPAPEKTEASAEQQPADGAATQEAQSQP